MERVAAGSVTPIIALSAALPYTKASTPRVESEKGGAPTTRFRATSGTSPSETPAAKASATVASARGWRPNRRAIHSATNGPKTRVASRQRSASAKNPPATSHGSARASSQPASHQRSRSETVTPRVSRRTSVSWSRNGP